MYVNINRIDLLYNLIIIIFLLKRNKDSKSLMLRDGVKYYLHYLIKLSHRIIPIPYCKTQKMVSVVVSVCGLRLSSSTLLNYKQRETQNQAYVVEFDKSFN